MVMSFKHFAGALVVFSILVGLFIGVYNDLNTNYDIGDVYTADVEGLSSNSTIVEQFETMNVVDGVQTLVDQIVTLTSPSSGLFDIVGGLILGGVGIMKTVFGLLTFPYDITRVILTFYSGSVPAGILGGLAMLIVTYAAFIYISFWLGKD